MKAPPLWVCAIVCGWIEVYQIITTEEWKVCAERQPVKVSQEAVNGPIKSTRSDKPPKSANTSRRHCPPASAKLWVTWACLRGQELLPTDRDPDRDCSRTTWKPPECQCSRLTQSEHPALSLQLFSLHGCGWAPVETTREAQIYSPNISCCWQQLQLFHNISTQLSSHLLRIAWFDLCLPQFYPSQRKGNSLHIHNCTVFFFFPQCLEQTCVFGIQY